MNEILERPVRPETVTTWSNVHERLDSEYGNLPYQEWCEKEVDRINRTGGNVFVGFRQRTTDAKTGQKQNECAILKTIKKG